MATPRVSQYLPPDIDPTKIPIAYGSRALPKLNEELQAVELLTRKKALMALCDRCRPERVGPVRWVGARGGAPGGSRGQGGGGPQLRQPPGRDEVGPPGAPTAAREGRGGAPQLRQPPIQLAGDEVGVLLELRQPPGRDEVGSPPSSDSRPSSLRGTRWESPGDPTAAHPACGGRGGGPPGVLIPAQEGWHGDLPAFLGSPGGTALFLRPPPPPSVSTYASLLLGRLSET
uniref:Uncharacterized protein n=1 Tax=Sarcophilus harrisii TaxID=9305 RepID=A0A7N4UZC3_SARHA